MKNRKGLLLISITTIITILLWFFAGRAQGLMPLEQVRHIVAGLALNCFFLNFMLSTRNKTLEKWFNGLDKLYIHHKYIAISAIALLLVHALLGDILKTSEAVTIKTATGGLAMFMLVVLVGLTLFAKKLPYEKWKFTHKFTIIPYGFGLFHAYISSHIPLLTLSALGIWVGLTGLTGILLAVYSIFFHEKSQLNKKGTVSQVKRLSPNTLEWEITLEEPFQFSKGQFIFIKVLQPGIEYNTHPFSISGGEGNKILLTTKVSGDFTKQLYDSLLPGSKVLFEGPYGLMDFSQGKKKQLWIAGGIGITPFMAYLRDNQPDQKITLYYSFNGIESGIYKDWLSNFQEKNKQFSVHFIDTTSMPRLNFEEYVLEEETSIYLCGPEKMTRSYVNYFQKNYKDTDITYEAFKLR